MIMKLFKWTGNYMQDWSYQWILAYLYLKLQCEHNFLIKLRHSFSIFKKIFSNKDMWIRIDWIFDKIMKKKLLNLWWWNTPSTSRVWMLIIQLCYFICIKCIIVFISTFLLRTDQRFLDHFAFQLHLSNFCVLNPNTTSV